MKENLLTLYTYIARCENEIQTFSKRISHYLETDQ